MIWDEVKISECFPPHEKDLILSVPLSIRRPVDQLVWNNSLDGEYKVRLGYRLLCSGVGNNHASGSSNNEETDFHIFCECPFARAAWLYSKWGFKDIPQQFSSTGKWLNMLLQHLDKDAVEYIICVLWAIWKGRNLTIFKQERKEPNECVELGYDMCCQYRSAVAITNLVAQPYVSNKFKWRPSVHIKLNCDASTFVENGGKYVRAGFIVKGRNEEFLLAGGLKIAHYSSAAVAELKALLWALEICQHEQAQVSEIELDFVQVVKWIKGEQFNGVVGHIIADFCSVLRQLNCSMIKHCRRTTNMVAYEIAKTVQELGMAQLVWRGISTIPVSI
ncbi:uncharacterized protein LOC110428990 [Herrania umbratica]|uniref:Uncharacterized protein LOC110428990 n=1 Tax=Herrania umbratica TaxID=108875 RepID=A0A6J1BNA1_9ROSI|nr:uncharacterized protein LOC110428990 [Herrania umbratica]